MSVKYNVLIVEDEGLIANYIKGIIEEHEFICTGIAVSYDDAISILKSTKVDIILLDINLFGEKTGVDLAEEINKKYQIPFLYLTSYSDNDTINDLKKTNPEGYLSKPVNPVDIVTSLSIVCKKLFQKVTIAIGKKTYNINLNELLYISSDHIYLEVYYTSKKDVIRYSLQSILETLPENFLIRINRSIAINPQKIIGVNGNKLRLENSEEFKVSDKYKNVIQQHLSLI